MSLDHFVDFLPPSGLRNIAHRMQVSEYVMHHSLVGNNSSKLSVTTLANSSNVSAFFVIHHPGYPRDLFHANSLKFIN